MQYGSAHQPPSYPPNFRPNAASGGGGPLLGQAPDDGRIYPRIDLPGMAYAQQGSPHAMHATTSGWPHTANPSQYAGIPVSYPQISPYAHGSAAQHGTHARVPGRKPSGRARTRLRWENILPLLTVVALSAAAVMFLVADAPPGNGQKNASKAPNARAVSTASAPLSATDVAAKLQKVDALINAGAYTEAGVILQAMNDVRSTYPEIATMAARLDAREARNSQLMADLESHVDAGAWRKVRRTLRAIRQLHPLSAEQAALLRRANAQIRAGGSGAPGSSQADNSPSGSRGSGAHTNHAAQGGTQSSGAHGSHSSGSSSGGPPPDAAGSQPPAQRPPTSSSSGGTPLQPPPGSSGTPGTVS